jgi:hypothetical protein
VRPDTCGVEAVIEQLVGALSELLPLKIEEATFADPTLTLAGNGWAFSSISSWRVSKGGVLLFGWSDRSAAERIGDLSGQSVVSVAAPSSLIRADPALELSSGEWVEIFSDHPTDPWIFRLPSMTFVGSPSDPEYAR